MALYNALAEHADQRQGKEVFVGEGTFDSNGQLVIPAATLKFATIDAVIATFKKATAPGSHQISWGVSSGAVTLYAWEATAADNTALTASDALETVSYIIVGRRR